MLGSLKLTVVLPLISLDAAGLMQSSFIVQTLSFRVYGLGF